MDFVEIYKILFSFLLKHLHISSQDCFYFTLLYCKKLLILQSYAFARSFLFLKVFFPLSSWDKNSVKIIF